MTNAETKTIIRIHAEEDVRALPIASILIDCMGLSWQLLETFTDPVWRSPIGDYYHVYKLSEFVSNRGPFWVFPGPVEEEEQG